MKWNKKGALGTGSMKRLIKSMILVVIFFSIAVAVVPLGVTELQEFLGHIEGNTTLYGTAPSAVAGVVSDNIGFFIVLGVFTLTLTIVGGWFTLKKRRGY